MAVLDRFYYMHLVSSVVEVNFNGQNYTVNGSGGQVSVSLRITGQFFIPVYALIEVSNGSTTGEPAYIV